MRTGAASQTQGYFHQAAFYGSDDEFLAVVVPFLTDGVSAGEPTLVTLGEANSRLVRSALRDTDGISFVPAEMQYARPAASIRSYQEMMAKYTESGAAQIRIVGDVPHPGFGVEWGWWARYEAAVNEAYDAYPVWGLCPYDTRSTPDNVLADVARTHPHLATVDGAHIVNPEFVDPAGFLAGLMNCAPPVEPEPPTLALTDPTAAAARHAVQTAAAQQLSVLPDARVQDMMFAVSEGVENAILYGCAPMTVRLWGYRDRLVAHITDTGPGPADPYTGLVRVGNTATAGVGLWLAHQMCTDVTMHRHSEGFTLRIAVAAH